MMGQEHVKKHPSDRENEDLGCVVFNKYNRRRRVDSS